MDRRSFLRGLGAVVGGIALNQAVPFNRVYSFPKDVKCLNFSQYFIGVDMGRGEDRSAIVIMESTAHGRSGWFHEEYVTIKERQWFQRNGPFRMLTHVEQEIPGVVHLSEVAHWPVALPPQDPVSSISLADWPFSLDPEGS